MKKKKNQATVLYSTQDHAVITVHVLLFSLRLAHKVTRKTAIL
jgi:hypothetical protein